MQFSKMVFWFIFSYLFSYLFISSLTIVWLLNIEWGRNYFGVLIYLPMLIIGILKKCGWLRFSYKKHKKILYLFFYPWLLFILIINFRGVDPVKATQFYLLVHFSYSIFISLLAGNEKYKPAEPAV